MLATTPAPAAGNLNTIADTLSMTHPQSANATAEPSAPSSTPSPADRLAKTPRPEDYKSNPTRINPCR